MINALLILSFIIEPLLWLYASKKRFEIKNVKVAHMFIVLDITISMLEEYTRLVEWIGQELPSIAFFIYMTLFVCIAFDGAAKKKLLHAGLMLMFTLTSDIIVMMALSMLGISTEQMSSGFFNVLARLISKIVMLGIIQFVFKKKFSINAELIPFLFLIAILEVPGALVFKDSSNISILYIIIFATCQIGAGILLFYISHIIAKKKQVFVDVLEKSKILEMELENKTAELDKTMQFQKRLFQEQQVTQLRSSEEIEFFENRKKVRVKKSDILYIERTGRKILIVEQYAQHEINSSIVQLQKELGEDFCKISQGVLVNKKQIYSVEADVVKLKNRKILYASRGCKITP